MVKEMGLPRDSLERRRGGRGGPAPRRDRMDNGERVAKRMSNDYNTQFKKDVAHVAQKGGRGGVDKQGKKKGFNPMARAHMGSEAYKGHAKKLKAELIHKAKVKKDYAKVLKQEEENTPDFYKKIFGEKTIDDEGNVIAYKDGEDEAEDDQDQDDYEEMSGSDEEDLKGSGSASEEEEQEEERPAKKSKGNKGAATPFKAGKQEDGTFKRAAKPNPFKAAIEKREAEKKAIQDAREKAKRERALAQKGRDAYYANREKTTMRMQEKTSRGQPVMANQIKMMLGKIKEDVKENKTRAPVQRWGGRGGRKNAGRGTQRGTKKGTSSAHA